MASAEVQTIIDMLETMDLFGSGDIMQMRAGMDAAPPYPKPADVEWEAVDAGGVPAEWCIPNDAAAGRAIVYFHGGGYAIGSIEGNRGLCSNLARAARARVLNVGYRLAPEHPYPAALDDAVSAYRWVISNGFEPGRLAMGGDSAGGGLTLGALVTLRDAGDPMPGAAICLSPWVDMTLANETVERLASVDPMLEHTTLDVFRKAYLGASPAEKDPGASPLWAKLEGLPQMLIQVGGREVLLGEARDFSARAKAAGVDVTLDEWDEMIHVWQTFADIVPEGREAISRLGEYLEARLPE